MADASEYLILRTIEYLTLEAAQTTWCKMMSFLSWCICKITVAFLHMKRFIDRSVGAYFFGPPCIFTVCACVWKYGVKCSYKIFVIDTSKIRRQWHWVTVTVVTDVACVTIDFTAMRNVSFVSVTRSWICRWQTRRPVVNWRRNHSAGISECLASFCACLPRHLVTRCRVLCRQRLTLLLMQCVKWPAVSGLCCSYVFFRVIYYTILFAIFLQVYWLIS